MERYKCERQLCKFQKFIENMIKLFKKSYYNLKWLFSLFKIFKIFIFHIENILIEAHCS